MLDGLLDVFFVSPKKKPMTSSLHMKAAKPRTMNWLRSVNKEGCTGASQESQVVNHP